MDICKDLELITKTLLRQVYVHPVTFSMVYGPVIEIEANDVELDIDGKSINDDERVSNKSLESVAEYGWDWVPVPGVTNLHVYSTYNGNTDVRGGGCGELNIPVGEFDYTIVNNSGITIRDVVEATYRMKGSKYDYWYELFSCFENFTINGDTMTFEVNFDYGS